MTVRQMRVVVTADDYDAALAFYRDVLGLPELASFAAEGGRVTILEAGRATLELTDRPHAAYIDRVEVGERVAGHIRVAFEVTDAADMTSRLTDAGARLIAPPVTTPWNSLNSRLDGPAGLQLTLFEEFGGARPKGGGMDSLDQVVERYHAALRDFFKGEPGPVIRMFSQREDVVLCNPFRPFARGPGEVADTIEQAASHYADGKCEIERVIAFATAELGYTVEIERFTATVDGTDGSGALRVTTILRLEEDGWRIAHRHADPITTPRPAASVLQA